MKVKVAKCQKCLHEWIQRVPNPIKCPKCGHIIGCSVRKAKTGVPKVAKPNPTTALAKDPTNPKDGRSLL